MIAEQSKEKLSLHRNQKRVVEYGSCLLSAINDAILLYTVVAMGPIPPGVENTKGEKTSMLNLSYSFFIFPLLIQFMFCIAF